MLPVQHVDYTRQNVRKKRGVKAKPPEVSAIFNKTAACDGTHCGKQLWMKVDGEKASALFLLSIQRSRDAGSSLSKPGRIVLIKALLKSWPMICHLFM
jgi:hypothetical protein